MKRIITAILFLMFVLNLEAEAKIYHCKDQDGNDIFSDTYNSETCKEIKLDEQKIIGPVRFPERKFKKEDAWVPKDEGNEKTPLNEKVPIKRKEREPKEYNAKKVSARVLKVIDGDTIEVDYEGRKERVRYTGIDCPEMKQEWGLKAKELNQFLVSGYIELELDIRERDPFGRILAYVWSNGKMVNEELVKKGHAMVATYPPNVRYVDRFRKAQEEARLYKEGFWRDGGLQENPSDFIGKSKRRR